MTWNYRLVHRRIPIATLEPDCVDCYAIHEVYYDDWGNPEGFTMDPVDIVGDTLEEALSAYAQMAEAFEMPVLEYEDILA